MTGRLTKPVLVVVFSALALVSVAVAGSLTPSGPVAATMHSLANIYDSIASATFDSSAIVANQNGSLMANLKYIENQTAWASSSGNIWNLNSGNVGIGTTSPTAQLHMPGRLPSSPIASIALPQFPGSMAIRGNYAYIPSGFSTTRLSVVDISNPNAPVVVKTLSAGLSNARGITVQGKYLYVGSYSNSTLQIYDISNPASPVLMGSLAMSNGLEFISVNGPYAYVSFGNGTTPGLRVIDVSNPANPRQVASFNTSGGVSGIYVRGRYAYLSEWLVNQLEIIDISNPTSPRSISTISTVGGSPWGLQVVDDYAYVTTSTDGSLRIFNVASASAPTLVASVSTAASSNAVFVQGNRAYVGGSGITVVDVTNPTSPTTVGTIPTAVGAYPIVVGRYLYSAAAIGSFEVYDVSGAYIQQGEFGSLEATSLTVRNDIRAVDGNFLGSLIVNGDAAANNFYASSSWFNKLEITGTASISNSFFVLPTGNIGIASSSPDALLTIRGGNITHIANTNPAQVGLRQMAGGNGAGFAIADNTAYVANGSDVEVIDISNPASPSLITTVVTAGNAKMADVVGSMLYVADTSALNIYDISNRTSPRLVGSVSGLSNASGVYVRGGYAYVADVGAGVMKVVDVSNPSVPVVVFTSNASASTPYELSFSGNFLYSAFNNFGFGITDISDPKNPRQLVNIDPGNTRTVHATGKYLYAGGTTGLNIYDISNPSSPVLLSTIAKDTWMVVPSGKYLYATQYTGSVGLFVYDVSNPAAPKQVGYFADADPAALRVVGRYAYLVGFGGNFHVLDLNGTFTPTITTGTFQAGLADILGDTTIGGFLFARTGLNVGSQGILSEGAGAFDVKSSGSALTLAQRGRGNLLSLTSSASQVFYIQSSTSGNVNLTLQSPWARGTDGKFTLRSAGVNDRLDIINGAGTNLVSVASSGNVGIGSTVFSPPATGAALASGRLNVLGNISITGATTTSEVTQYFKMPTFMPAGQTNGYAIDFFGASLGGGGGAGTYAVPARSLMIFSETSNGTGSGNSGIKIPFWIEEGGNVILGTNTFTGFLGSNVGIGTGTPDARLDVTGNVLASSSGNVAFILKSTSATGNDAQFTLMTASTSDRFDIRGGTGTLSSTFLSIASTGFVGVGTIPQWVTRPTRPLEVYGSTWNNNTGSDLRVLDGSNIGAGITLLSYTDATLATLNGRYTLLATGAAASAPNGSFAIWNNSTSHYPLVVNSDDNIVVGAGLMRAHARFYIADGALENGGASSSFGIKANSVTTGSIASISATALAGGSIFNITVPASSSANNPHGLMLVQTNTGVVIASWSMGGTLALRGGILSRGISTACSGTNTPTTGCIDYAESFPTTDTTLTAGEVVAVDPHNPSGVIRATDTASVLGIISTNPAALITGSGLLSGATTHLNPEGTVPVALAGRVPVLLKGSVSAGDHLALSDIPGVAQKAISAGMTLGIALEDSSGPTVMTFVNTSYWVPVVELASSSLLLDKLLTADTVSTEPSGPLARLVRNVLAFIEDVFHVRIGDGSVESDTVKARNEICVGSVCATEEQFLRMMEKSGITTQATESATPTPTPNATPTPEATPTLSEAPPAATETPTPPPTDTSTATP